MVSLSGNFEQILARFLELVQKAFDGEMRDKPKGLTADLLPFQKEGVSWMYCQEVNVKGIQGRRFISDCDLF